MKRTEKIKLHFKENKKTYVSCGVTALVAVVGTVLLTKGSSTSLINQPICWKPRAEVNKVTLNMIERSTPSTPVHLVGTDLYFNSISEAARKTGHPLSTISKHVNGQIPNVKGDVFEVLQPA